MNATIFKINKIEDIQKRDINIKKPIIHSDAFTLFDVFYKNKFFLVQFDSIQLTNRHTNTFVSTSFDKLEQLTNTILDRVEQNKHYTSLFSEKTRYKSVSGSHLRIQNMSILDTIVFDLNGDTIDLNRILPSDDLKLLLYIKHIWINKTQYGCKICVSQILRNEPLGIRDSMFIGMGRFIKQTSIICQNTQPQQPQQPPPPPPHNGRTVKSNDIKTAIRPTLSELLTGLKNLKNLKITKL
jgi:hypothetical protein